MAEMATVVRDLWSLNGVSAKVAAFAVRVCHPQLVSYTFQRNGVQKDGRLFCCRLVTDHGYIEGQDRKAPEQALTKYKINTQWIMSKITLNHKIAATYVASDVKFVVDMASTNFASWDKNLADLPEMWCPRASIKDILTISTRQSLDLLACIQSTVEKTVKLKDATEKTVLEMVVLDGSKDDDGNTLTLTINCWDTAFAKTLSSCQGKTVLILWLGFALS